MGETHPVVVSQVLQRKRCAARGNVRGAGNHAVTVVLEQLATDIPRVLQRTAAKGHVDAVGNQVDTGIAEHKIKLHSRMRG
ncbi:hypothetical protein D3C72_2281260 [compost metagenome]